MLLPTSMQVANNLLVATGSNNLVATRSIRVTFLLDPTCFELLYGSTMVVASNMLDFVSSGCYVLIYLTIGRVRLTNLDESIKLLSS